MSAIVVGAVVLFQTFCIIVIARLHDRALTRSRLLFEHWMQALVAIVDECDRPDVARGLADALWDDLGFGRVSSDSRLKSRVNRDPPPSRRWR